MYKLTFITACGILLLPLLALSAQHESPVVQQIEKPATVHSVKAKTSKRPKTTTSRDKLSSTGFGEDPGEETQERPNPLDKKGLERTAPIKAPQR